MQILSNTDLQDFISQRYMEMQGMTIKERREKRLKRTVVFQVCRVKKVMMSLTWIRTRVNMKS